MNDSSYSVVLVTLVVVVASTPAPVMAQGPPSSPVLGDTGHEKVGSVTLQGKSYTVHRYDNVLPYASGLEVYTDGEEIEDSGRVQEIVEVLAAKRILSRQEVDTSDIAPGTITSTSKAKQAFRIVAWRKAATELGSEDISTLQEIKSTSKRIERIVSPPLSGLNAIIDLFDWMKNTEVLGQSVWSVATTQAPSLKQFDSAARELRSELQKWKDAADQVNRNVPKVITSLQKVKANEKVDYGKLGERFSAAMTGLEKLETQSDQVAEDLSSASDTSASIADAVADIPAVGGELSTAFGDLSNTLDSAAGRVSEFGSTLEEQQSKLSNVRQTAESEQSRLVSEWQSTNEQLLGEWRTRRSAETKVYATGGGALILLAAAGGLLYRRRREEEAATGVSRRGSEEAASEPASPPPDDDRGQTPPEAAEPPEEQPDTDTDPPVVEGAPGGSGAGADTEVDHGGAPSGDTSPSPVEPEEPPEESGDVDAAPPEPTAPEGPPAERAATLRARVRQGAADRRTVEGLVDLLDAEDAVAREDAVKALKQVATDHPTVIESNVSGLVDLLDAGEPDEVRKAAAETLRQLAGVHQEAVTAAVTACIDLLDAEDPSLRTAACHVLGTVRDDRAVDELRELSDDDPNMGVRVAADKALRNIQG